MYLSPERFAAVELISSPVGYPVSNNRLSYNIKIIYKKIASKCNLNILAMLGLLKYTLTSSNLD